MATDKHRRSDIRTRPRDHDPLTGLSFIAYLISTYPRGFDWIPDRLPSGVSKIHESRPEGGKPPMRRFFLDWLDGKKPGVPGVTHAQVARAIARAKVRDPMRLASLEWRQEPSSVNKATARAFCAARGITSSTLSRWTYRAVKLVAEELEADLNGMRYEDDGAPASYNLRHKEGS